MRYYLLVLLNLNTHKAALLISVKLKQNITSSRPTYDRFFFSVQSISDDVINISRYYGLSVSIIQVSLK